MPLSVTALPMIYCDEYSRCETIPVALPFGLPTFQFSDPCCRGLDTLAKDLGQLLAPLMPFLNLLDCIVKLVEIVLAVPDAIGPPPDPMEVLKIGGKITKFLPCVVNLAKMAPLPINIIEFAKFILSLVRILLALLRCLKRVLRVRISLQADILSLGNSTDPLLLEMGRCLVEQDLRLGDNVRAQVNALLNIFNIINAFLGIILLAVPPLKSEMESRGIYPIVPDMEATGGVSFEGIDSTIAVLQTIEVIVSVIAGA